jgi:Cu-Zn family superoxide dismutase
LSSVLQRLLTNLAEPLLFKRPAAMAFIHGSADYPELKGEVRFYQAPAGVLVLAGISGLPSAGEGCETGFFGFHIHEGESCTGNVQDPFANVQTHFNPEGCPHPAHAGDLPPLLSTQGNAYLAAVTSRFTINEIMGRTVIIHDHPDDFTTQPSGNSGKKIGCGQIEAVS